MHDNERQELNALRAEKMSLQAKVDNLFFFITWAEHCLMLLLLVVEIIKIWAHTGAREHEGAERMQQGTPANREEG